MSYVNVAFFQVNHSPQDCTLSTPDQNNYNTNLQQPPYIARDFGSYLD